MKTTKFLTILSVFLFASCNPLDLPWKTIPVTKEPPVMNYELMCSSPDAYSCLTVFKFKKEEYKDMVILEKESDDKWHIRGAVDMLRAPLSAGTMPYRELEDGYLVFDWRIVPVFFYFPYTRLVNLPWSSIKNWEMSLAEESITFVDDTDPIVELYNISYEWLEWYEGKRETQWQPLIGMPINQTWYPLFPNDFMTFSWALNKEEERFCEYMDVLNSIIKTDGLQSVFYKVDE